MLHITSKICRLSVAVLFCCSLSACELTDSEQRIYKAQMSANASDLLKNLNEDEQTLINQIIKDVEIIKSNKNQTIKDILTKNGQTLDLTFQGISDSISLNASDQFFASNLMVSNKGHSLSVISDVHGGRFLGYGLDIFKQIFKTNKFAQHQPILKRSLNWLITNDANMPPMGKLRIANSGYDKNLLKKFFQVSYNLQVEVINCNLFDQNNPCWQQADLLVIGGGHKPTVAENNNLTATFQQYQNSKKPLLYLSAGWWSANDRRTQFLTQYGISPDDYPGNYFVQPAELLSTNSRAINDIIKANDNLSDVVNALTAVRDNKAPIVNELEEMVKGIQKIGLAFKQKNEANQAIFYNKEFYNKASNRKSILANKETQLLQKMALLADIWRDGVRYDGFSKSQNPLRYLKSSVADNWLDFNRPYSIAPKEGVGDYMPKSAYNLPVSNQWETITVTLPQKGGYTAIGRASIPAKGLQLQLVSSKRADNKGESDARLAVQTGYIRTTDKDSDNYYRPRNATSFSLPINKNKLTNFVSPYGGALFLRYNNAQAGDTVTLKIKGGAKYAHFDFVKGMSKTEMSDAVQELQSGKFGWNTIKFVGGEIQQSTKYAQKEIATQNPNEYINRIKTVVFDSNHIANGYNNMSLDYDTKQACTRLNWDCTSKIHNAPSVQHFVGWLAACGSLCSGQPIDAFSGVNTSWGWVHELGHNTVQPVLTMTFKSTKNGKKIGCSNNCDNNILAGLSMLRKYEIYAEDDKEHNFGHYLLYQQLEASRATGKTGGALRADVENRIWQGGGLVNNDAKRAVHMQLAFLYSKLHKNQAKPNSQAVFEFFRLLNIGNRLVDKVDWKKATQADKAKLGFEGYSKKDFSNPELTFMLASKIIGYDLTDFFTLYGLPLSDTAKQSVAKLNLPKAPLSFYAQAEGDANLLANGQWIENVSLQGDLPKYPF